LPTNNDINNQRALAIEVRRRLEAVYHATGPSRGHGCTSIPAVDELVLTFLSQATTDINSWRGYQALRTAFPSWEAVADAPVEKIEELIRPCGLSRQKAPRILAALHRIRAEQGAISLDFLCDIPRVDALAYLLSIRGVGRKTASCVLLFSLGIPALSVDTHVWRICKRLGLISAKTTADAAHAILEGIVPEADYLPFHVNVIAHGKAICTARTPKCSACVLAEICPSAVL